MATPAKTSPLERRKQVRVRLRPNLVCTAQPAAGQTQYVLKDPITLCYFRLDEGQHFAVSLMDGRHTLDEIRKAYEERFRPERLSLEELEAFTAQLLDSGLAENETPGAGKLLFERSEKHRHDALRAKLLNFLYLKIPLFDPDALLARLAPRVRFLFARWFVLLAVGFVLTALGLIATHWSAFQARLPAYREFLTFPALLYLWAAIGLAKVLHEFGHGLCCKVQSGEVHEMGALLLVFSPALYCDVTDSWTLPDRWRRMAISAAGIYVDLLAAAAATWLWWLSVPETLLHNLCFGMMLVCGISTLVWNANPLMRFDGYYAVSDWLEIPNLAETSSRFLRSLVLRWLGVRVPAEPLPPGGRPVLFVGYAVASYVYRVVVVAGVVYFLYTFLKPYKLGVIGFVLGTAALGVTVGWPAFGLVHAVYQQGRLPEMKPARTWLFLGTLLLLVAGFFALPIPLKVEGQALIQVEPDQVRRVAIPETGGFLQEVCVRDGQPVRAGDVLAVLANPSLEIKLRVNEADQVLRSEQRSSHTAGLTEGSTPGDQVAVSLQHTEYELKALEREHATLQERRDRLTLRAPCDGVVLGLGSPELKGKWLEKGTELCRLGNTGSLRAVLLVEPADHRLIAVGGRAVVRVHGRGLQHWEGVVTEIAQVDANKIPPQLSSRAGGEVATQQDPDSRLEKPRQQHYLVAVRVQDPDGAIQPGVLARVKIEAGSQTGWWRLRRYLAKTFSWGL
jgi:putative peptide zinc metalloprotease protein